MTTESGVNGKPHKCEFPPCRATAPADQPLCGRHVEEMQFFIFCLEKVAVKNIPIKAILVALTTPPTQTQQTGKLFGPQGQKLD